jgi:Zn finger protein HypA/HybF involved in hydrogenase expression
VVVAVGAAAGVDAEALRFCWDVVVEERAARGAKLVMQRCGITVAALPYAAETYRASLIPVFSESVCGSLRQSPEVVDTTRGDNVEKDEREIPQ